MVSPIHVIYISEFVSLGLCYGSMTIFCLDLSDCFVSDLFYLKHIINIDLVYLVVDSCFLVSV